MQWELSGKAAALTDGAYTVAIRPHHVSPVRESGDQVELNGKVSVTELSGSESSAHFTLGDQSWVSLASGVHPYKVGSDHAFYMDPAKCFYFAPDGAAVA